MKSTLDRILQANRIIRLIQRKIIRLHDSNQIDLLNDLIPKANIMMKYKNTIENVEGRRPAKPLTLQSINNNIDKLRTLVA